MLILEYSKFGNWHEHLLSNSEASKIALAPLYSSQNQHIDLRSDQVSSLLCQNLPIATY